MLVGESDEQCLCNKFGKTFRLRDGLIYIGSSAPTHRLLAEIRTAPSEKQDQ